MIISSSDYTGDSPPREGRDIEQSHCPITQATVLPARDDKVKTSVGQAVLSRTMIVVAVTAFIVAVYSLDECLCKLLPI